MRRSAITLIASTAIIFVLTHSHASANSASVNANNYSFALGPGSTSQGSTLYFTTYDGSNGVPLHDTFGEVAYFSDELKPTTPGSGTYRGDYLAWDSSYGFYEYGSYSLTLPTTDTDGNGCPDILQVDKAVNTTLTGTGQSDWSYFGGSLSYTMSGPFHRAAGSDTGTYSLTLHFGSQSLTANGTIQLAHWNGTVSYTPGDPNLALSLTLVQPNGDVRTLTGTPSYTINSVNQITVAACTLLDDLSRSYSVGAFSLQRTGNHYRGNANLVDGNRETSWGDYRDCWVEITDTNDANGNGIPDLSDPVQSRSLQVTISPAGAVSAGAQWQVDGGAWQNSGVTVSSLSVGTHTVTFKTVSGYTTPGDQTVTIADGALTQATGTYTLVPTRIIGLDSNLAFGNVQIGTTATRTLTISNTGNSTLTVNSISYPTGFSGAWSGSILAGASQNVTVTFAPATAVNYGGTLTVDSDATSGTGTLSASGTGSCVYALSSTSASIAAGGINDSITVYAGNGCAWMAMGDTSWIHTSSAGTGDGTVIYTVDANFGVARSGVIAVQGQVFTLHQAGNILSTIGNTPVVAVGDPVVFGPGLFGVATNSASCLWDFGDGQTSIDCEPSHVFSNCGPHEVMAVVSDEIPLVTNSLLVSVACPFAELPKAASLKMKSNFAPGKLDTATIKASLDLPLGFSVTNTPVSLEVAGAIVPFTLNAKGQGVNAFSKIKLSHKGKGASTVWQVSANLKGDWDAVWQNYGLTNATVKTMPITVPVLLFFDTESPESFFIDKSLLYKATAGKSGTGQ